MARAARQREEGKKLRRLRWFFPSSLQHERQGFPL